MKQQRGVRSKLTTLGIHQGKTMIHTLRPTILDGETTQTLGGEVSKIKTKTRDVTTPTTMQLTNNSHRGHLNTPTTTLLHTPIKTKTAHLLRINHQLMTSSLRLKPYLKEYAKRFKKIRCSKRRCEPILRTRERPLGSWNSRWDV